MWAFFPGGIIGIEYGKHLPFPHRRLFVRPGGQRSCKRADLPRGELLPADLADSLLHDGAPRDHHSADRDPLDRHRSSEGETRFQQCMND